MKDKLIMITTRFRHLLAQRSYQLHRDQLEKDFSNKLNEPHDHSIRSFHTLLAGMVDGENRNLHGSWGWGAPTGWGKSTGLCAFFAAAERTGKLLGQPDRAWDHNTHLSAIVTAAKIESLYILEKLMLKMGVPAHRVMVLHADTTGDYRPSDEGKDAPICLVAHNKLKHVARKWSSEDEHTKFLSYRGEVRDICLVDEAFNDAETTYVDEGFLADALKTLVGKARSDRGMYALLLDTLGPLLTMIETENARQEGLSGLERAEGMIHPPALSKAEVIELVRQVKSIRMMKDAHRLLLTFLSMLPAPIRLFRGKQSGVVSVVNTMPLCLTNRIELNASFEIGMLSALNPSMKNADDHFPMLQKLQSVYGLEGLADIIDYSDMRVTHLQRGGGKSTMSRHLEDIRKQTESTKEVLDFYIEAIKATPEGECVLVFTYLDDGVEYVQQLKRVFKKAGIDVNRPVVTANGETHPFVSFVTYGNHLSSNEYRYASTGILAGVQQRHKADVAGSMCGARKSIASPVSFLEVDMVHQAMASGDAQQAIGRLQCRQVKDGKALPVRVFVVHLDSKDRVFHSRLMKAFPRATWVDQESENRLKKSQAYQVMLKVGEYLESNYRGTAVKTAVIREHVSKVTGTYKKDYRLELLCKKMFADAIKLFLKRNETTWVRVGHSLDTKASRLGFRAEDAA